MKERFDVLVDGVLGDFQGVGHELPRLAVEKRKENGPLAMCQAEHHAGGQVVVGFDRMQKA